MKKIFPAFWTIILLIPSCKKDGLTKETQKGANTFSCKVDGKIFKPYDAHDINLFTGNYPVLIVSNSYNDKRFSIYAKNEATGQNISIEYSYISVVGSYKLNENPHRGIYDGGFVDPVWSQTDSNHTGILVLTRCDMYKKIYSGTFSFTAKTNTGRLVQVTDGRFDLKEN